jgi:hypothetical protein
VVHCQLADTDTSTAKNVLLTAFADWHPRFRALVADVDADGALVPRRIHVLHVHDGGQHLRHQLGIPNAK